MSARKAETVPRKTGRIPRWARWVGAVLLLVIAAASAAYLGRERWIAPFALSRVAELVREATGLELSVGKLGGNWWSELELVDVELSGGKPTTELTSVRVARATARYDLLDLIRGDLGAISSIELALGAVELDLDRELPPHPSPRPEEPPFPWPAKFPPIDARDIGVFLSLGETRFEAHGVHALHAEASGENKSRWKVHSDRIVFTDPHFGQRTGPLDADVAYRAGVFEVPRLDLEATTVGRDLEIDLRKVARADVRFSGTIHLFDGELEFRGATADRVLQIWTDARGAELGALFQELRVPLPFTGRAHLSGVFRAPFASMSDWNARVWGRVDAPTYQRHQFDQFTFAGGFDRDQLELREGLLVRGANSLTVADFGVAFAGGELGLILRSLRGSADLELFDPRALLGEAAPDVLGAADRVHLSRLSVNLSEAGISVRTGEIETDVGVLSIKRGSAKWDGSSGRWYEGIVLDLDAALSFEDIAPLAALLGQGEAKGALAGTVELRGPVLSPSGRFLLAGNGLTLHELELGRVTIDAEANQHHLRLSRLELDGAFGQATANGDFAYASGVISNSRVRAHTFALETLTRKRAAADFVTLDATIAGVWRDPAIWASAQAWGLQVEGRSVEKLDVEGLYSHFCARIDRLLASVAGVAVDAAGSVCWPRGGESLGVELDRAQLARNELDLALEAPLEVEISQAATLVHGLCVGGSAGRAIVDLSWTSAEQDLSIEASDLVPMRLLKPFLPEGVVIEGVQGSLSYHRSAQDVVANVAMRVDDLQFFAGSPRAALSFGAQLVSGELQIRELVVSAPGHYGVSVSGRIPTDPFTREWLKDGPFELTGEANVSDFASLPFEVLGISSDWRGDGSARFRLGGTSSFVRGTVDASVNVTEYPTDSIWSRAQTGAFQFEGAATLGDEITLEQARIVSPDRASAILDGRLGLRVDLRSWLSSGVPDWSSLPVWLAVKLSAQDLGFVAGISPALRRTGGELHGDLRLEGTLHSPELSGSVDLAHGEVRLSNSLAAFETMTAHFEFDRTSVRVVTLVGEYGAAPFEAEGTIEFGAHEPKLDLQVKGYDLLLAREEGLRLRADAELKLSGALSALELSGAVIVVDGRFSKEFELVSLPGEKTARRTREVELPFLRRAPWANVEFAVSVTARKPIRIDTNIARGTIEPRLELRGSGSAPQLSGTLVIGSTRVRLPAATLEVTSGVLTFRGESRLVPDLDITATTRVRGYDITAQVSGTSAEPELLFTSSPPLSSEELAILVLTGQLPESALGGPGSEAAAETVAVYLGRDLLTRWLGIEGDSEDPISERLEFYQGAEVSQTGNESTEFIFRLTPNPKGKRRILYLRAEKDIYERINFGVKLLFRLK